MYSRPSVPLVKHAEKEEQWDPQLPPSRPTVPFDPREEMKQWADLDLMSNAAPPACEAHQIRFRKEGTGPHTPAQERGLFVIQLAPSYGYYEPDATSIWYKDATNASLRRNVVWSCTVYYVVDRRDYEMDRTSSRKYANGETRQLAARLLSKDWTGPTRENVIRVCRKPPGRIEEFPPFETTIYNSVADYQRHLIAQEKRLPDLLAKCDGSRKTAAQAFQASEKVYDERIVPYFGDQRHGFKANSFFLAAGKQFLLELGRAYGANLVKTQADGIVKTLNWIGNKERLAKLMGPVAAGLVNNKTVQKMVQNSIDQVLLGQMNAAFDTLKALLNPAEAGKLGLDEEAAKNAAKGMLKAFLSIALSPRGHTSVGVEAAQEGVVEMAEVIAETIVHRGKLDGHLAADITPQVLFNVISEAGISTIRSVLDDRLANVRVGGPVRAALMTELRMLSGQIRYLNAGLSAIGAGNEALNECRIATNTRNESLLTYRSRMSVCLGRAGSYLDRNDHFSIPLSDEERQSLGL